jgi:hypothetical protein
MVIASLVVPRNAKNADGAEMTISLQQIFTVRAQSAQVPKRDAKQKKLNKGKQSTEAAPQGTEEKATTLLQIQKAVGGLFGLGG